MRLLESDHLGSALRNNSISPVKHLTIE